MFAVISQADHDSFNLSDDSENINLFVSWAHFHLNNLLDDRCS